MTSEEREGKLGKDRPNKRLRDIFSCLFAGSNDASQITSIAVFHVEVNCVFLDDMVVVVVANNIGMNKRL